MMVGTAFATDTTSDESYMLEVIAPKVDNNVFPVPIQYYRDLMASKKNLAAVLEVPMKLTITNPKRRRLMLIYTTGANEGPLPFGTLLSRINQVSIDRKIRAKGNLESFLPDTRHKVYRLKKISAQTVIHFKLGITREHFHNGEVKVHIASTNTAELHELCYFNTPCTSAATFSIVPRFVKYASSIEDQSMFDFVVVRQNLTVKDANIDLDLFQNNKLFKRIDHKALPSTVNVTLKKMMFNPNTVLDKKISTEVSNIDMYPIIHYMSNNSYRNGDAIIFTSAAHRPDLGPVKKKAPAKKK